MTDNPQPTPVNAELMDVTRICSTFPRPSGIQIRRDNLHHTLETILDSDIHVLTVEGTEGIGKTTLLAQFAQRHLNRCVSMFVRPTSRFAYDPTILRADLCNQINWILFSEEISASSASDPSLYGQLVMELQRRARKPGQRFFFIVDGLEALPRDVTDLENLIELLPLGLPQFRFLFSGNSDELGKLTNRRIIFKSVPIPGFTLDETTRFFSDFDFPPELTSEIFKVCKGVPSHLAAIKRIVHSGVSADSLIEKLPDTMFAFFEIEWKIVDEGNELQIGVLTLLAHDRRKLTISDIATVFEVHTDKVVEVLKPLGFIAFPADKDSEVAFVSEAFRNFAATRLRGYRDQMRSRVIQSLLKEPTSEDALTYLPNFLEESGKLNDLLEFLSPDYFASMIEASHSLAPVQQKADLGVRAAIRLDRDDDLLRFGLQEAVITQLDGCQISSSEVKARMALDDYGESLALAQTVVLKQDRLRLLALIARLQKEKGLTPEPELMEQVYKLYQETDPSALGENLVELATDLMYSRPDLAIQLIERAPSSIREGGSADWALVRLSVEFAAQTREPSSTCSPAEEIRSRIKDPAALKFSTAISFVVGNYSASEVLRQIEKLESRADQLFLLQEWTENTRQPETAGDIIEHALRLAIRSTEYTPLATHLCQLATPLPFLANVDQRRSLIGTFDTQKATVEKLGPTEDYVRLQLLLTQAEALHDRESATNRLLEIYYYICDIRELETRTCCRARLVASLDDIDPEHALADTKEVAETTERDLRTSIEQLLSTTADHYLVTRNILKALARNRGDLAVQVAGSLNTEPRRDSALLDTLDQILQQRALKIPFALLEQSLNKFAQPDQRDQAIEHVLRRVARYKEETIVKLIDHVVPFIQRTANIEDLGQRYRAICSGLIILLQSNATKYSSLKSKLEIDLNRTWESMELGSEKVEAGFSIASSLATHLRDRAAQYLNLADTLRRTAAVNYNDASCFNCIRLAIRAYAGLLPKKFDTEQDLEKLETQIERVLPDHSRLRLWTDLALRCIQHGRVTDGKRLVVERIRPNLDSISKRCEAEWKVGVVL